VKIIIELISTLALATKQVKQGRFSEFVLVHYDGLLNRTEKFMGKLRGEKDIEATIQRLDRLTLDEGRATAAQTLEVVCGLVQQKRAIMDGENLIRFVPFFLRLPAECSYPQTPTGANRQLVSRAL
jgi:hypothetical protein